MILWLNGELLAHREAGIDPADRGFTLGDGLFETIRVTDSRPVHYGRHLARLQQGASLLGIPLPWFDDDIAIAIRETLMANRLDVAVLRLTLTRGPAPRGILPPHVPKPTLLLSAAPFLQPPAAVTAVVARSTCRNERSPLCRIKSLNFLDNVLARQEAAARGADEALLLNTEGRVAEATIANLFVLRRGVLLTPPVADGALPGVTRSVLLERCGAKEEELRPEHLFEAEAVFLTNSLGLRSVCAIDGWAVNREDATIRAIAARAMHD